MWRIMYLTGSWLAFKSPSPRAATQKLWFKSKADAEAYIAFATTNVAVASRAAMIQDRQ